MTVPYFIDNGFFGISAGIDFIVQLDFQSVILLSVAVVFSVHAGHVESKRNNNTSRNEQVDNYHGNLCHINDKL